MTPELWMTVPFVGLLLSIAILPLAAKHFWHSLKNQALVVVVFSIPILIIYVQHEPHALLESIEHYLSFVVLLGALFVISGGIWISGNLKGTPLANTIFLGAGAILSNFIGTTGASMVLIRPLLSANSFRKHHIHLPIFFIILVSNIGGCLTPIGDPPLFLGFLMGVPFFWTLKLFPQWLFTVGLLLAIFFILDFWFIKKDLTLKPKTSKPFSFELRGKRNLLCLAAVIAAVFIPQPYREVVMVVSALISLKITPKEFHKENNFNLYPIAEVAILFLGIFITMVPALELLRLRGGELGISEPWQFFWSTGAFSSVLDNAPTYLTFVALGQGLGMSGPHLNLPENVLTAISLGAVFFGALTYIGNAPNFMVRSISDASGWKVPSFFGYIAWSALLLIPLFFLISLIFF